MEISHFLGLIIISAFSVSIVPNSDCGWNSTHHCGVSRRKFGWNANRLDKPVEYIVSTIDKSVEHLPTRITSSNDFKEIDKTDCLFYKIEGVVVQQVPLFNGECHFWFDTFKDKDRVKVFNTNFTIRKNGKKPPRCCWNGIASRLMRIM